MSRRDYRVGESFRGTELGRNFKPHGLDKVGAEDLRAFHARMEQLRKEAKLQEHMIAPIGRILAADEAAKQAMETLREQTLAELNQQDLSKAPLPPKHGPPLSIRGTNCARSDTPYDAEWTSKHGNCLATASKTTGFANTSVGMSSADSQLAQGGIMVLVIPQFADDILQVSADVHLAYNWRVKTVLGPTAHTNGRFRTLVYAYPAPTVVTTPVNQSQVLWSAGSSGIDDDQSGSNDFWESPSFTLSGSPVYEVWFIITNQGDASSGWPGWAGSWSHLWMTLADVCVKDCQCG